jgi:hypothetical protein
MSPYALIGASVVAVAAIAGAYWTGYRGGASSVQAEWNEERATQAEATSATNRAMLRGFENAAESSRKEKERAKVKTDRLRADLRSGAVRLSVPVASCKQSDGSGAGDTEARAEILPGSADRIGAIGIGSDDTVRDLNACIDKYNALKQAIEGGR